MKPRATVAFLGSRWFWWHAIKQVVTYYPSEILRVPDEAAKRELYGMLVSDLGLAKAAALNH